jgi:hypothetical protein
MSESRATRPFLSRWLIGSTAAFGLVTACSVSMQLQVLGSPEHLLAVCLGVLVTSVPAGAAVAFAIRRSDLALVLGSQVLVVAALASWFTARA